MLERVRRVTAVVAAGGLVVGGIAALDIAGAPPAEAYNVCSDPDSPCTHEEMASFGLDLLPEGSEAKGFETQLRAGAGDEDVFDHIYGYPNHEILGAAIITMTHFWDADPGDLTPSTYGDFEGPVDLIDTSFIVTENALQKARHFWTLALGAYARNDKGKAYEYLGHIAHFLGDMTVPTHAHGDAHVDLFGDHDPYEEWMSNSTDDRPIPLTTQDWGLIHAAEASSAAGPMNGPLEGNVPPGVDPLYYLLYTTNQLSDFFASRDVDGDTFDRHGWMQAQLDSMAQTITRPRVQDDLDNNDDDGLGPIGSPTEDINNLDGDLGRVRDVTYLYGIRAIAALYRVFEQTARQPVLAVGIEYVEDSDDDADTLDDADFYGKVTVNGRLGQNRGEEAVDDEVVENPGWAYGASVPLAGTVPVHLEILDEDGESPLVPSLNGPDDLIDIDPDDSDGDRTLDLQVDMDKCVKRLPGAITGDATGACGQLLETEGDHDPLIGDSERAKVRFRIFMPNLPPVANAGPDVQTPEGTDVVLDGSGSFDPEGGPLTYSWDLDGDGACDDSSGTAAPTFDRVGDDGTTTVKICVTDDSGLAASDTAVVTVTNVAPTINIGTPAAITENTAVTIAGTISDPGWLDSLSATIDWGDGSAVQNLTGTLENTRPDATLTFSTARTYGDNGVYSVKVCAADDHANPCTTIAVTVNNVDPTATIDTTGTVSVNGVPTVIAHAGASVDFGVRITDPGSDDLTITWDWGDGTPVDTSTSLVNPPNPDPAKSPSIQPRDISAADDHVFAEACVYTSALDVADDDGGTDDGSLNVVIVGNNHPNRPHGYWKQQHRFHAFGTGPTSDFDADTLDCYLLIAAYMSRVFDERTSAATFAQAYDVLDTSATSDTYELFDQQLLAAWLNFANGAIEWDRPVDTDRDRRADTPFLDAMVSAESLRIDPDSTRQELDAMKKILESWTSLP
ncbi:PKD domain-containing protein [Agromyces bauzanensis]